MLRFRGSVEFNCIESIPSLTFKVFLVLQRFLFDFRDFNALFSVRVEVKIATKHG